MTRPVAGIAPDRVSTTSAVKPSAAFERFNEADTQAPAIPTWPPSARPSPDLIGVHKADAQRLRALAIEQAGQRVSAAIAWLWHARFDKL